MNNPQASVDNQYVRLLISRLRGVHKDIDALFDGQVDAVFDLTDATTSLLPEAQAGLFDRHQFSTIAEQLPVGLGLADHNGRTLLLNPEGLRLLGYESLEELRVRGGDIHEEFALAYPDGRAMPAHEAPLDRAFRGEPVRNFEMSMRRHPDGKEKILSCSAVLLHGPRGEIDQVIFSLQEVTERVRAEKDLREIQERQMLLAGLLRSHREISDEDGVLASASSALGIHLGVNAVGFFEIIDDETVGFRTAWSMEGVKPLDGTVPIQRIGVSDPYSMVARRLHGLSGTVGDGLQLGTSPVEVGVWSPIVFDDRWRAGMYLLDSTGREWSDAETELISEVGSLAWDSVERIRAVESMQLSEERYRRTFENAASGVAHVSLDGAYLRVNRKFSEILGYGEAELLKATFRTITHPDDLRTEMELMQGLLKGDVREYAIEKRFIAQNASPVWTAVTRSVVSGPDGRPEYFIDVVVDISLRKELESSLMRANETLERRVEERTARLEELTEDLRALVLRLSEVEQRERHRLASLIHDDLQQLLVASKIQFTAWRGSSAQTESDSAYEYAMSLLDQAIDGARSLTTQLTPPALYESGLADALKWLVGWMKQSTGFDAELTLSASTDDLPQQEAVIIFDSAKELLLNAVKYSGAKRASVKLEKTGDEWLVLTVSDNGNGFNPDALTAPRHDGGGIGLFGIRQRIAAAGGSFEMESAPGEGATFRLFWPRPASAMSKVAEPEQADRVGSTPTQLDAKSDDDNRLSVLLVDDHALLRQSVADLLGRQPDLRVVGEASDGQEAIDAVRDFRPQIVLMDVNLPNLGGVQATRFIKQRYPGVCVIGVSMHRDPAIKRAMIEAGASAYLSKDGPVDILLDTIREQVLNFSKV